MTDTIDDRQMSTSVKRGLRKRCPSCGEGYLFKGYLKVVDACPACGEEMQHHRADDGPAYLTILVVGHILAPMIHIVFTTYRPEPLFMALFFSAICIALSLFLLPRMKGMVVAIQWSRRMHGFGRDVAKA